MNKKITNNWKAIEEVEQQVKEKTGDPEAGFNASTFWMGGDGRHLMIPCLYRGKKGNNFNKSYKEMMIYARYCPFSGLPLYEGLSEPLTVDFIKKQGFELVDTSHEEEFYYEDCTCKKIDYALTIFFNYYKDGRVTYDVDMDGYELKNVGQNELNMLMKILPKSHE